MFFWDKIIGEGSLVLKPWYWKLVYEVKKVWNFTKSKNKNYLGIR